MNKLFQYIKHFKTGASLMFMINVLNTIGFVFASLYSKSQGLPLFKIALIWAISPAIAMLTLAVLKYFYIRSFMIIGTLCYTFKAMSLIFYNNYTFILYGVLSGLALGVFWVSLNYVFFSNSSSSNHARDSSVYFIIPSLLGIFLPLFGAIIISQFGFENLFLFTAILSLFPLVSSFKEIPNTVSVCSIFDSFKRFKHLKLITFVEGALHFYKATFVPVYVLLFLNTEYEIGGFKSLLAIVGFVASIILSYYSDKEQKRLKYLRPLLIIMGILILTMGFINNLFWWFVLLGIYVLLDDITQPLRFSIPMDIKEKDIAFWKASEFFGNFGRVVFLGLSAIFIYYELYWLPFIIFSVLALSYPIIICRKLRNSVY